VEDDGRRSSMHGEILVRDHERDYLEDLDVDGSTVLKCILKM